MDQATAQLLFEQGASLVFLDMPEGSEFGIDFNSWNVGAEFRGMKMIPPGVHFVYYSAIDRDKQAAPRSGFFHNFSKREILVKKWDPSIEDIKMDAVRPEELARFEESKKNMDRFLAPYPYESFKKWVSLTNHITPQILVDLQPECGIICAVAQFISEASTSQSRKRNAEIEAMEGDGGDQQSENKTRHSSAEDKLPSLKAAQGTRIRYSEIPTQKYPAGANPSEITKYSIDSSFQLETLQKRYKANPSGILGEIQFAFICFLVGQTYDSFEHWKQLVHLLCTSDEALHTYPKLFTDFIGMLHFQIREIPEDFFVDIVSQNNFLTTTLHELFSNLESQDVDATLRSRGLKFRQHLTEKFKWDFTSEPDEYAPVVVESAD
ncbi:protein AAR2 homolog [Littorina saxatilis]|uniref:Protein AAR2 homolog n=1 Tax=Littorina saxatilis TaxID=31220 RepID=A0AAN9AW36_9CAEN